MTQIRILVAEDEQSISESVKKYLTKHGYLVKTVSNGEEALSEFEVFNPHVVILDVVMPELDGYQVCKKLRQKDDYVGIIMLTQRSDEVDKILGFDMGADDYLPKPFSLQELLARVKALTKRLYRSKEIAKYVNEDLEIDFVSYVATKRSMPLNLSPKEFKLLYYLICNKGQVISRQELLEVVWGYPSSQIATRTVDNHIARLRLKLEDDPNNPKHLLTVHGVGYKFVG